MATGKMMSSAISLAPSSLLTELIVSPVAVVSVLKRERVGEGEIIDDRSLDGALLLSLQEEAHRRPPSPRRRPSSPS